MRILLALTQLLALTLAMPITSASSLAERGAPANYIVIFKNAADTTDAVYKTLLQELKELGVKVNYQYKTIVKGFSITMDSGSLDSLLALSSAEHPFIVEEDKGVHAQ